MFPESFLSGHGANMSTKHVRSAADLARFECALAIECDACDNSRTLNGFDVAKRHGTKPFAEIQQRMKCSLSEAKDARLTVLSPPAAR